MTEQEMSIKRLEAQGFKFSNWIPFQPDADNQPAEGTEAQQTAVMIRRQRPYRNEYREVDPNGDIN